MTLRKKTRPTLLSDFPRMLKFNDHIIDISMLPDNAVIIDAGACQNVDIPVSSTSELADDLKNYTIYAIEPERDNIKLLEQSTSQREDKDSIHLMKKALVGNNFKGADALYTFNNKPGWSSMIDVGCGQIPKTFDNQYSVDVIKISELCDMFERIDYFKMDIEGMEYDIFSTISDKDLKKIQQISIEYHHRSKAETKIMDARGICDVLVKSGFDIKYHDENNFEIYAVR
jgi:FkbM family methyltransferase